MDESKVIETPETEMQQQDTKYWDQVKSQLDEFKLKYTEDAGNNLFVVEYSGRKIFKTVTLKVFTTPADYVCIGMMYCDILESQRAAVDQYLMRVNFDLLLEKGKFAADYEHNLVCVSMRSSNPRDVVFDIIRALIWLEGFQIGFLAVSGAILSVDQAAKLEKEASMRLEEEKFYEYLGALRNTAAQ